MQTQSETTLQDTSGNELPSEMPDRLGLIIGSMKSGTSALYNCIQEHPQAAACVTKEPYYLSRDDYLHQGMSGYAKLWDWDPQKHTIAIEASTSYTKLPSEPDVAERLRKWSDGINPIEYRFIYQVRNPIDRINSHFFHEASQMGWSVSETKKRLIDEAIAFSNYQLQLDPYLNHFGRESILVVPYEQFTAEPGVVVRRCFEHFDLDPDFIPSSLGERRNDGSWYRDKMRPAFWHRLRKIGLYHQAKKLVPLSMRKSISGKVNANMIASTRLTPREAKEVMDRLRDDLKQFCDTYEFDAQQWWPDAL